MAVLQMQKVQAVVHQSQTDAFLTCVQKFGALEFTDVTDSTLTDIDSVAPHAALLPRVQHAVQFLVPYRAQAGLLTKLRTGATTDCPETDIAQRLDDMDVTVAVITDVEALQVALSEKTAEVMQLEEQHGLLKAWEVVENKLSDIDTQMTTSLLVALPADDKNSLSDRIVAAIEDTVAAYGLDVLGSAALVTVPKAVATEVQTLLTDSKLIVIDRPQGVETATVELAAVEERLAAGKGELGVIHDQAEHTAHTHLRELEITGEILEWEQARFATLDSGKGTATTAVFTGWLVADSRAAVEAELQDQGIAAAFSELDLTQDEQPPVEIKNNSFFKPFEVVTRLYGMPGYKDLDPTLFLAGFFFIFFGLSLTDVGYGITLMAVATIVLTLFKVSPGVKTFMKLLLFMGLGSALLGMLFGGYLGIPMEVLPAWLQAIQLFDPIGNPLPVFYLALGLGVVQVMFGLLLKIYSEYRNGRLMEGVMDKGPWLMLFVVGILFVGVVTGYVQGITTGTLTNLIYVGFALVVLSAARHGEGIVGKLISVLAALYNDTIGYFSDILSYSRLLALGLATSALAFAVNLIAELVGGTPVVGPILTIIVLFIGHTFALVINTLGAFIHSARLQFVEFFGKFIDGTGRSFAPLSRSSRHITAREE